MTADHYILAARKPQIRVYLPQEHHRSSISESSTNPPAMPPVNQISDAFGKWWPLGWCGGGSIESDTCELQGRGWLPDGRTCRRMDRSWLSLCCIQCRAVKMVIHYHLARASPVTIVCWLMCLYFPH